MIEELTENPGITIYVAIGFIVWLIMTKKMMHNWF